MYGGEGEIILTVLCTALHCWCYRITIRKRYFTCVLRHLPLLSTPSLSLPASGRARPSRATRRSYEFKYPNSNKKRKQTQGLLSFFGGEGEI